MTWFDKNIESIKRGFDGESFIRKLFIKKNIPFMQVDVMFKRSKNWCLGEIKTQEMFEAPPFDGHGLPQWQIEMRLKFYRDTGIIPYLIVYDIKNKCLFIGNIIELEKGDKFKTKGKKPRTIYPLESFEKYELETKEDELEIKGDEFKRIDEVNALIAEQKGKY